MKCKIETSNGIMFLKGIDGDKRLEIADYIELHDSSLTYGKFKNIFIGGRIM